jgi:hypothetical protein
VSPALTLEQAMRDRLLAHAPLTALLGGSHVYDELPRGAHPPFVAMASIETRDWSVMEAKGHEHAVTIGVATRERSRELAEQIAGEIEAALDRATLTLTGHVLIDLQHIFTSVTRPRGGDHFGAVVRLRAVTEPLA